jgi:hypothetical protein
LPARVPRSRPVKRPLRLLLAVLIAQLLPGAAAKPLPARIEFNRDVRPILSDNCFHCHGFDEKTRDGGRRLDVGAGALAEVDGVRAIVPGKPEESDLWVRVISDDKDEVMPPPKAHKKLAARDKEILKRWIEQGAEYQDHWAYIAPAKLTTPAGAM